MLPDPIERAEASAERAYDQLSLPDGKMKCPSCDAPFDPEKEGGPISADPYAIPVCPRCLELDYLKHTAEKFHKALLRLWDEAQNHSDGADDASAHDKLCNRIEGFILSTLPFPLL